MFVPTYEYQCDKCGRTFEVRQRISEAPLTTCEKCGGAVRRLISPAPFILKGEGWYVTDYPSAARKKAMESEKTSSGTSSAPSSGEKSSTPAPASDASSSGAAAKPSSSSAE